MCSTSDIAKNSRVASTATSFSKALQVKATVERKRGPLHTYNEIPGDERVVPLVVLLALATRSEDDRNVVGAQVQPAGDVGEEGANDVLVDVDGVVTFDQEPLPDDFGCQVSHAPPPGWSSEARRSVAADTHHAVCARSVSPTRCGPGPSLRIHGRRLSRPPRRDLPGQLDEMGTPDNRFDDEEIDGTFEIVRGSTGRNDTQDRDFCADLVTFTS